MKEDIIEADGKYFQVTPSLEIDHWRKIFCRATNISNQYEMKCDLGYFLRISSLIHNQQRLWQMKQTEYSSQN